MKSKTNPLYMIFFITVPQGLLFLTISLLGLWGVVLEGLPGIIGAAALLASALVALFFGIAKRGTESAPIKLLACLLLLQAVGNVCVIVHLFGAALPQASLSLEALALFLGAVGMLYLCVQLYLSRNEIAATKLWRDMGLFLLLPFVCALALNFSIEHLANTILMDLGIAMACAAVLYFVLFVLTFLRAPGKDDDGEEACEPQKPSWITKVSNNWIVVLIFAIILLQVGLLVNDSFEGLFGDYSSPWFIVLFLMNGIVMLPIWQQKHLSLPLLYLKTMGFTVVAYMTFVFIPFLPFGLVGIIFMGLGLLVFVPLFVFILELKQIVDNVKGLRKRWNKPAIVLVMLAGILTIPAVFAVNAYADKLNYQTAQAYMDPAAEVQKEVDVARLAHTLDEMEASYYDTTFTPDLFGNTGNPGTPLFSAVYNEIVLDGRSLSGKSLQRMRSIFFDVQQQEQSGWRTSLADSDTFVEGSGGVLLEKADTRTEFDEEAGVYRTWVDMEIGNNTPSSGAEYAVRFHLPDGCFIKDYYLYVGDEQKFGMLTDRRAALVTYESVVRASQDPGVLCYADQNTVELRVFPFEGYETRKTGFYVMHSQQETLEIDGQTIVLEAPQQANEKPLDMGSAVFIPAGYKEKLETAQRSPVYYFVVDTSYNSPVREHIWKVKDYAAKHGIDDATVIFASYRTQQVELASLPDDIPAQAHFDREIGGEQIRAKGGFNLGAAMWQAQYEQMKGESFPLIIAVSDNVTSAVLPENMQEYAYFPESEYYYNLGYDLSLLPYSFADGEQLGRPVKQPIVNEVLRYGDGYVSAEPGSEVLYRFVEDPTQIRFAAGEYGNAFLLMQKTLLMQGDVDVVRDAFRQKVLTPATAFSVFETKEQEAALLALQEEIMNGKSTDATDAAPVINMDESVELVVAIAVVAGLVLLAWAGRRRKKAV